jgi:hypothetical protein
MTAHGYAPYDLDKYEHAPVAEALLRIAYQLECLGTGGASDPRGAVEYLAIEIHAGLTEVAEAIEHLSRATREDS